MTDSTRNRRRRYLINPKFQWGYLRTILLLECVVFAVAVLMTLAVDHLILNPAMAGGGYWNRLVIYLVIAFAVMIALLLRLGLKISNRISGPLYRVRAVLQEVSEGRLPTRCQIREGDKHPEVADALTAALTALKRRQESDALAWREVAQKLAALAGQCSGDVGESLRQAAHTAELRGRVGES